MYSFIHDGSLQKKTSRKSDDSFICQICGSHFGCNRTVNSHIILVHTNNGYHKCELCSKQFSMYNSLVWHLHNEHSPDKVPKCCKCGRVFPSCSLLQTHCCVSFGGLPLSCQKCSIVFTDVDAFTTQHPCIVNENAFVCPCCLFSSAKRECFGIHLGRHVGKAYFTCDLCSRRFSCKSSLAQHLKKHKNTTKISCKICGKEFKSDATIVRHGLLMHSPKTLKCKECPKRFALPSMLKYHVLLIHTRKRMLNGFLLSGEELRENVARRERTDDKNGPSESRSPKNSTVDIDSWLNIQQLNLHVKKGASQPLSSIESSSCTALNAKEVVGIKPACIVSQHEVEEWKERSCNDQTVSMEKRDDEEITESVEALLPSNSCRPSGKDFNDTLSGSGESMLSSAQDNPHHENPSIEIESSSCNWFLTRSKRKIYYPVGSIKILQPKVVLTDMLSGYSRDPSFLNRLPAGVKRSIKKRKSRGLCRNSNSCQESSAYNSVPTTSSKPRKRECNGFLRPSGLPQKACLDLSSDSVSLCQTNRFIDTSNMRSIAQHRQAQQRASLSKYLPIFDNTQSEDSSNEESDVV